VTLLPVLAALLLEAPTAPAPRIEATQAAAFLDVVSAAVREQGIPGLSAAVAVDGEVVWTGGFGEADVENHVPARSETVYRLASLSKPITAVAVLQLAERGRLDLDADIRTYVPAFPPKPWRVTARELLAHLGGIRHYQGDEFGSTRRYVSLLEGLDVFKDDPLAHEPGTAYLYSTHGYTLLGAAVEAVSGRRFADYLHDNVFVPAGMLSARDDDARAILENRAAGYYRTPDGRLVNSLPADTSYKIPGGGLVASAPDVARFAMALLDGRLVRTETRAQMLTRQKTRAGRVLGYGLGFSLGDQDGHLEVWHSGAQQRVRNMLYLWPDRRTAVVLLANLEGASLLGLARRIAAIVRP
jgi:serine beta-lactamase-like protein LACTB